MMDITTDVIIFRNRTTEIKVKGYTRDVKERKNNIITEESKSKDIDIFIATAEETQLFTEISVSVSDITKVAGMHQGSKVVLLGHQCAHFYW